MSEGMDSLITIGEYFGSTHADNYKSEAIVEHSPAVQEKEPSPKGTIGTIASEVQLINDRKQDLQLGGVIGEDAGELTSLEEAEFSHLHDASLIQLEKDMNGIEKSKKGADVNMKMVTHM